MANMALLMLSCSYSGKPKDWETKMKQFINSATSPANPFDAKDSESFTALHHAVAMSPAKGALQALNAMERLSSANLKKTLARLIVDVMESAVKFGNFKTLDWLLAREESRPIPDEELRRLWNLAVKLANQADDNPDRYQKCAAELGKRLPLDPFTILDQSKRLPAHFDVHARLPDTKWTLLHIAAKHGLSDACEELIQEGADVNAQDNEKRTPLHRAAMFGQVECIRVLVKHGADPQVRSHYDFTPLQDAQRYLHRNAEDELVKLTCTDTRSPYYEQLCADVFDYARVDDVTAVMRFCQRLPALCAKSLGGETLLSIAVC